MLADQRLHEFIGGRPASRIELSERYAKLVAGAGKPGETWRNWIVRTSPDSLAVGTVQATIDDREGRSRAAIAWVIVTDWQGRGFASEAARGLVGWLRDEGAEEIVAHVHTDRQRARPRRRRRSGRSHGSRSSVRRTSSSDGAGRSGCSHVRCASPSGPQELTAVDREHVDEFGQRRACDETVPVNGCGDIASCEAWSGACTA